MKRKKQFEKVYEIANGDHIGLDSFGVTILEREHQTKTTKCLSWEDVRKAIKIRHHLDSIYLLETNPGLHLFEQVLRFLDKKVLPYLLRLTSDIDIDGIEIEEGVLYSDGGEGDIFGRIYPEYVLIDDCGDGYRVDFTELNIHDKLYLIAELEGDDE